MGNYYLAIDIGASSGRHILSTLEKGRIVSEEIYRFDNQMEHQNGHLCWNYRRLFEHIIEGLKKCKTLGKIPKSIGIDTWAVDFVLLDDQNQVIGETFAYRDQRTQGMDQKVYEVIDEDQLYHRIGIQKQIFNSIYQLMALKEQSPEHLYGAKDFLMVPDYFNFLLTGEKVNEYTNATTTGLLCPLSKAWDEDLIEALGYPREIFNSIVEPGEVIGDFSPAISELLGFNAKVIAATSHDTASAVVAIPSNDDHPLYISSGTWSLMGTECTNANRTLESQRLNFTNEGGYRHRFRYLKNIMGLWMIQCIKKEKVPDWSFASLCEAASKSTISSLVDCNDNRFLAPDNMTLEIEDYLVETGQDLPQNIGDLAHIIYNSLAQTYAQTLQEIKQMTGIKYEKMHIVGGGANADYLNHLTQKATGITVIAGPTEATAIGNILVQMLADHVFKDLKEARQCVYDSNQMKVYEEVNHG